MPTLTVKPKKKAKAQKAKEPKAESKAGLVDRPRISGLDPNVLVDQRTVAGILGTAEKFLETRRCNGGGPKFVKIGKFCRYRMADVNAWIEAQLANSTSDTQPAA
jgi:hypothetical protein